MYQTETINQYDNYIESRLSKIQSFIFDNKIKEQQNLFNFVQVRDYEQKMSQLWDKVKWIQINVRDNVIWMNKVEQKLESVNAIVDKVGLIWRKVSNMDGKMIELEQTVRNLSKKQWEKSMHIEQMTQLKDQIGGYEKQIEQLKQQIVQIEYKNRLSIPTFNLPQQIIVTKKQLRESIEELQRIYDKKMQKIGRDVKKLKKQKSNKKIIKMIENNHDYYNLENIMHRKSEDSNSSNLKPLILDTNSKPTNKSSTEYKIQGFHRRSQQQKQSYLSANARQSSNSRRHGESNNQTRKKSRKKIKSKSRNKMRSI